MGPKVLRGVEPLGKRFFRSASLGLKPIQTTAWKAEMRRAFLYTFALISAVLLVGCSAGVFPTATSPSQTPSGPAMEATAIPPTKTPPSTSEPGANQANLKTLVLRVSGFT